MVRKFSLKILFLCMMRFLIELMTTPQLHYIVRCYNDNGLYGESTEAGYFNKLCTAFKKLIEVKRNNFYILKYFFL